LSGALFTLMRRARPLLAGAMILALASCTAPPDGAEKRFPTSQDYGPQIMARISLTAGGDHGWRLSALETPPRAAPWKIVVITGTPSWSEYWAPTLAQVPANRVMIVADRPGFAESEPQKAVTSIAAQAEALGAMLDGPPEQKVVLIGQSYGGPVATMLAAQRPDKVKALVLMSAFFGDRGPTVKRLAALGGAARPLLPRDMKNALAEIAAQKPQLPAVEQALAALTIPIVVLHGEKDTFVTPDAARALAARANAAYVALPDGDHFLNACCVAGVLAAAEQAITAAEAL
jgi:pimeloyl-ACP methyl ester carboxylesterase